MARSKLVSLVLSLVTLSIFALVMVKGIAAFERRAFEASRALLKAGAEHVELSLATYGHGLTEVASGIAADPELAQTLRQLTTQVGVLSAAPKPPERLKNLVLTGTKKVNERVTALRVELVGREVVDAVAVIDDLGLVVASDSASLRAGARLPLPPLVPAVTGVDGADGAGEQAPGGEQGGATQGTQGAAPKRERATPQSPQGSLSRERGVVSALWVPGSESGTVLARAQDDAAAGAPKPAPAPSAAAEAAPAPQAPAPEPLTPAGELVASALRSGVRQGRIAEGGHVVYVGAAPILLKGKVAGVVVTERRLRTLPKPTGVEALLLVDGQVRLGKAPEGFKPRANVPTEPFLLVQRAVNAVVPKIGPVPMRPLFVDNANVGLWAQRFEVPGVKQAGGFVFTDVTPLFTELGGFQVVTLAIALAIFLVHALMILSIGRGLVNGVGRMADFLGRYQQGLPGETKLNERQYPGPLHRLARLINKSLERGGAPGPGVVPNPRAPSLDDVIQAQVTSEAIPDIGELEFEGITNAGSIAAGSEAPPVTAAAAIAKPAAPPAAPPAAAAPPPAPASALGQSMGRSTAAASGASSFDPAPPARRQTVPIDEDGFESMIGDADALVPRREQPHAELPDFGAAAGELDSLVSGGLEPPSPIGEERTPPRAGTAAAELMAQLAERAPAAAPPGLENLAESTPAPPAPPAPGGELMDAFVFDAETPGGDGEREAHWRDVFRQFVEVRGQCGESTADLTYEKFTVKLQQSRDAVMAKHSCSDVRFQVYVKNGRAALKATPYR